MNGSAPLPRVTLTSLGIIAALFISIGNGVWNAAVLSNQVAANRESIDTLKKEMEAERERRVSTAQQLATIEVKVDLLLNRKDGQ